MIEDAGLLARAEAVVRAYTAAGKRLATAESCTGGLVSALLTAVSGSSAVVERGFVTYSNEAKREMLGVSQAILDAHGAVSPQTARAMAEGALAASRAEVAVSITGVAGPGGGSADKPVGLVHFALARTSAEPRMLERRYGAIDRGEVRRRAVEDALGLLEHALTGSAPKTG